MTKRFYLHENNSISNKSHDHGQLHAASIESIIILLATYSRLIFASIAVYYKAKLVLLMNVDFVLCTNQ